ncbi:MAG: polysaccharide biosynthesis tyrosine autokinase [Alphaproteobacteria bacterium]|nr:polysaccharide biosynthesis tyrosine autokinase [Alphaproteobacteria bacterium]
MELLTLYTALLRRKWVILQAVVLFTVGAAILSVVLPKNFRTSSRVLVSTSDTSLSILNDLGLGEIAQGLSNTDDIQNKITLATTRPVLDEVIWRLQLRDDDGRLYTAEELLVPGTFGEIEARPNITVSQQQGTDLLVFEARANDPELAQLIANTVVEVAIQRAQQRARQDTRSARVFIEEQLVVVRKEFDQALTQIADAQAAEEVIDLETELKAAIARLSELMLGYEQNAAQIQEVRGRIAEARSMQGREDVARISASTTQINREIAGLQEKLAELRQKRAVELTDKTSQHPDVLDLDEVIADTEARLSAALDVQHELDPGVAQLEAQLAGLVRKGAEIDASIQRTTDQFRSYPDKMRRMSQLKMAAQAAEDVYTSLQEQGYQVGVAESMLVSDMQMVEPALAPERHYSPKLLVNVIFGLVAGSVFGLGLAFLLEYIDDTVRTPEELQQVWGVPKLGVVPKFKLTGERRVVDELPTTHPISESYRTIRNGLMYASLDKPLRLIAVSSAVPSEGKSTFSVNLGISFAREGKRVLIVDCDLRRPAQHRNFPQVSNHVGLTDVLTGKTTVEEAVQETTVENLVMLTSGPTPADPGRLVESLRLRQLLLDLRKQYDVVLVDTPPCLVVNDSIVIGRAVDGLILVVESGSTSRKLVAEMKNRFDVSGLEPVGVVLNKLDFVSSGYGYYYKAYRRYDQGDAAPAEPSGPAAGGGAA